LPQSAAEQSEWVIVASSSAFVKMNTRTGVSYIAYEYKTMSGYTNWEKMSTRP
jgi:hypothetical protein